MKKYTNLAEQQRDTQVSLNQWLSVMIQIRSLHPNVCIQQDLFSSHCVVRNTSFPREMSHDGSSYVELQCHLLPILLHIKKLLSQNEIVHALDSPNGSIKVRQLRVRYPRTVVVVTVQSTRHSAVDKGTYYTWLVAVFILQIINHVLYMDVVIQCISHLSKIIVSVRGRPTVYQ